MGSRLRELGKVVDEEGELSFVTTADKIGKKTYRRSVILLMQKAIHNLYGADGIDVRVKYSIGQGYYCELVSKTDAAEKATAFLPQHVAEIKAEMLRMVKEDIPIKKESWNTDKAVELFKEQAMPDKERLFRYRRSSRVNIYNLDGYRDYFYGYLQRGLSILIFWQRQKVLCCCFRMRIQKWWQNMNRDQSFLQH